MNASARSPAGCGCSCARNPCARSQWALPACLSRHKFVDTFLIMQYLAFCNRSSEGAFAEGEGGGWPGTRFHRAAERCSAGYLTIESEQDAGLQARMAHVIFEAEVIYGAGRTPGCGPFGDVIYASKGHLWPRRQHVCRSPVRDVIYGEKGHLWWPGSCRDRSG